MLAQEMGQECAEAAARRTLPPLSTYLEIGRSRGIGWTDLRRKVLTILWRDGAAWGAYALADEMRRAGSAIYPTSLYRVITLLEEAGLIVSIASSRRVQIAPDPRQDDWAVLHCTRCGQQNLVPFEGGAAFVRGAAHDLGHATERLIIECLGRCGSCDASTPAAKQLDEAACPVG